MSLLRLAHSDLQRAQVQQQRLLRMACGRDGARRQMGPEEFELWRHAYAMQQRELERCGWMLSSRDLAANEAAGNFGPSGA